MIKSKLYLALVLGAGILFITGCNLMESSSVEHENQTGALLAKIPALTPGDVCMDPPTGIVGWWPGDNNSLDWSGNENNGTLNGNAAFYQGAVDFGFKTDPLGDYIEVADAEVLNPVDALTLEAWIFVNENTYYPAIINKGNVATADESYSLFLDPWGKLGIILNSNGTFGGRTMFVGPSVPRNEWMHVAAVYTNNVVALYLDGVLMGSKSHSGGIYRSTPPVIMGLMEKSVDLLTLPSLNGMMDEPTIYNRALTGLEILGIYNAGSLGKCKSPEQPTPEPETNLTHEDSLKIEEILNNPNLDSATVVKRIANVVMKSDITVIKEEKEILIDALRLDGATKKEIKVVKDSIKTVINDLKKEFRKEFPKKKK